MAAKIASWVVRLGGLIMIVLGLLFWTGNALGLVQEHMTLGLLVVLALWVLAATAMRKGVERWPGDWRVRAGSGGDRLRHDAESLMSGATRAVVEIIKVVHLLLGLALISFGEIITGRLRRLDQGSKPVGGIAIAHNRSPLGRWRHRASGVPFCCPLVRIRVTCDTVCSHA